MSNFTPHISFEIPFDGEIAKGKMRRMTRLEFLRLSPVLGKSEHTDEAEHVRLQCEILPVCMIEFSGITIEGKEVQLEEIIEGFYFAPLVRQLWAMLMEESIVWPDKGKKPEGPPPGGAPALPSGGVR